MIKTTEAAKGKWPGILKQLGVDESYLRDRHGPCPMCGGSDRYRFDDKDGTGSYYCNQCGPGDGMNLAMSITGKAFADVAKEIDSMVGNIEPETMKPKGDPAMRILKTMGYCKEVVISDPVSLYLRGRGLAKCKGILHHPAMPYYEDGRKQGDHPAMVAPFVTPSGDMATLHITYLDRSGNKARVGAVKKILPVSLPMPGGAIRLTDVYPHIGIAEGIETAIAVMKLYRVPCWATATAGMMEKFTAPDRVESVTVYGDNDSNFVGQASAYRLAHRLSVAGLKVDVQIPDGENDFADVLKRKLQEKAA